MEESDVVCGLVVSSEVYLDEKVSDEVLHLENRAGGGSLSVAAWLVWRAHITGMQKTERNGQRRGRVEVGLVQNLLAMQRP